VRAEQSLERDREWRWRWRHTWARRSYVILTSSLTPSLLLFCADAEFGTDPLLASHWAVGTFVVVSLGTWSVLASPSCCRRPDSETASPLAQDDMSAEYLGGTKAGADCRGTTSQASARKAEGRGDAALTILMHGCIFATRKTRISISRTIIFPILSTDSTSRFPWEMKRSRRYHVIE